MICVTAVDGEWLAELGPMFYSIKHSGGTRLENKLLDLKSQQLLEKEMERANEEMKRLRELQEARSTVKTPVATPGRKPIVKAANSSQSQVMTPRRNRANFGL